MHRWNNARRFLGLPSLAVRLVVCCLILAVYLIGEGLRDDLAPCDVALVLGSKVNSDGKPSRSLRARLDRAVEVYQKRLVGRIVVSGGTGREGYDEAAVMARYLCERGVPSACIIEDPAGVTTEASAKNTARLLREENLRSVLVVSQYFHIARSRLALNREGVGEVRSAHAYLFCLRDLCSIPREVAGYLCYSTRVPGRLRTQG